MPNYIQYYDNLYGYIDFEKGLYDKILKDPFFLRLHNLRQMGLAYQVFPDALHTRFAHSIGVYAIVTKMIDAQKRFCSPSIIDGKEKDKIMISALLHDIGHLPLSHTIELALEEYEQELLTFEKQQDELFSDGESPKEDSQDTKAPTSDAVDKPALHEMLGEYVLQASNISTYLSERGISPLEISSGFKGDIAYAQKEELEKGTFYNKQIRNFLHSQFDADRIDYLLRDSSFSGVKTGGFDLDKLLNSIYYGNNIEYGVDESAIRAIEQFFMSRFVAYCQIVGNRRVMAFGYMAKDFYYRLLKSRDKVEDILGKKLYSYRDLIYRVLINNPEEFLEFTDEYFFLLVREVLKKKSTIGSVDPIITKYAEMITYGIPLSAVTYFEAFDPLIEPCFIESLSSNTDLKNEIANKLGMTSDDIIIPAPMKVKIYQGAKDAIQVFSKGRLLHSDVSNSPASILNYLKDKVLKIYRIYTFDESRVDELRTELAAKAKSYRYPGDLVS